jgi:cell wall assembly regulator SMI1
LLAGEVIVSHFDDALWSAIVEHAKTELGPPASVEEIARFEQSAAVRLPPSHKEFLQRANGGQVGFVLLFGVGRDDALDLGRAVHEMRPDIEATAEGPVLPFARDWGGSYFCYDLANGPANIDYPILYWNHEFEEEPEGRPFLWSPFAQNFIAFIQKAISK